MHPIIGKLMFFTYYFLLLNTVFAQSPIEAIQAEFNEAKDQNNFYQMGLAQYKMATALWKDEKVFQAHQYATDALDLWAKSDTVDYFNTYKLHRDISAMLAKFSKYDEALLHLYQAKYFIDEHVNRHPLISKKYNDFQLPNEVIYFEALYMRHLGRLDEAAQRLLPLTTQDYMKKNPSWYAQAKNQIGLGYMQTKDYLKAKQTFAEIIKTEGLKDDEKADYYHNLGYAHLKLNELNQAIANISFAAKLNENNDDNTSIFVNYMDLTEAYLMNNQPSEAITVSAKALETGLDISYQPKRFIIHRLIEKAYYALNNQDSAKAHGVLFENYLDEFHQEARMVLEREQALQFDLQVSEVRQNQVIEANANLYKKKKIGFIIATLSLVIMIYLFFFVIRNYRIKVLNRMFQR